MSSKRCDEPFHESSLPICISNVRGNVKYISEPAASYVSTKSTPPQKCLRVAAQIEMVKSKYSSNKPEKVG